MGIPSVENERTPLPRRSRRIPRIVPLNGQNASHPFVYISCISAHSEPIYLLTISYLLTYKQTAQRISPQRWLVAPVLLDILTAL